MSSSCLMWFLSTKTQVKWYINLENYTKSNENTFTIAITIRTFFVCVKQLITISSLRQIQFQPVSITNSNDFVNKIDTSLCNRNNKVINTKSNYTEGTF